ncbi:MAG: holdfast anchor protein HfaD, partial [Asticcacaulis sp.]|nr:holdfast anchor protein HfaD [Asticcacaulis sp.]
MSRVLAAAAAVAVVLAAVPATDFAQEVVDNTQDQEGDVLASQTLTVVENDGLTQGEASATGNHMLGGNTAVDASLYNYQFARGNISGDVRITGTNAGDEDLSLGTPVFAASQGVANYASWVVQDGNLSAMNNHQDSQAATVSATTHITAPNNAIYVSGEGDATAVVNQTSYQVTNGRLDAASWQTSATDSKANVSAIVHYSPSPNAYNASASNNYYSSLSEDRGSQEHETHQDTSGVTQARSEVFGGNMWLVTSQGTAAANTVDLQNQGGSLVVDNHQSQTGGVQAQSVVQTYEYGEAHSTASAVGNQMTAGNNDIYVRIDNDQVS